VLVVEDGPTITHGGMPFGAGTVAALAAGAQVVDPRPHAAGSIAATYAAYPHIGPVLPAMGYSAAQLADLEATIAATPCDAVIAGTPIDLGRLVGSPVPIRETSYELRERPGPSLAEALVPVVERARALASGRRSG
jgi:predicted GTPase